jgi:hypothetical protein
MVVRRFLDVMERDVGDAVPRGGMDHATTHISRTLLTLDDRGRTDLAAILRSALHAAQRIEEESRRRREGAQHHSELLVLHFEAPGA